MAILGFVIAFFILRSEVAQRQLPAVLAYDLTLYAYIGGWIGARLFLIPTGWDIFVEDPVGFLLSGSGWVWYGGVIGGAWAAWLLASRREVPFAMLGDIAAPALAMGLAIGRVGCQLSGDGDYGVATDMPWGMSYPNGVVPTTEIVHPTPVYEMIGCLLIYGYLRRRKRDQEAVGDQLGRYLILAGVLRFVVEFFRRNPNWLFALTTAQWISLGCVGLGLLICRRSATTDESSAAA